VAARLKGGVMPLDGSDTDATMKLPDWPWPQMIGTTVIAQTIAGGTPVALIPFSDLQRISRLHDSALKVEWASKQLQLLKARIHESHFDTDYISILRAELDQKSGYHIFTIAEMPNVGVYCADLSLTAADLIGNLRSSLEYLAWRFANEFCSGTPPDPNAVQFPICDTPADFVRQERLKKQVHPDAFAFMEKYQPYHGIDGRHDSYFGTYQHQLAHLRDLSNSEKHRLTELFLMLPTQVWYGPVQTAECEEEIYGHKVKRTDFTFLGTGDPIFPGMPVLALRLKDEPDSIEKAGSVNPHIAMSGQRPMIETLDRILTFVHMTLSDCARLSYRQGDLK
jgi:hypothetical protein